MSFSGPVMKRADRLIGASVVAMVVIVWVVLVGFDTLTHLLRELGDVGKNGYSFADAVIYIAWTLPRRMYQWFGNAALIGSLLALGGLATRGELTALRAAGMSKLRIVGSVILTLAVMTAAVMALGETLAPYGARQAQAVQLRVHAANLGMTTDSGFWARDGDSIVNAKRVLIVRDGQRTEVRLADVRVFTFASDGQLTRYVHADGATTGEGGKWTLEQARVSRLDASGVHSHEAKSMAWSTHLDATVLKQSVIHPEYLSMVDLHRNIQYLTRNHQNAVPYAKAFWAHAFYPVNVLVLIICALPFAFGALRSGGLGKRIFLGVVLALVWYFLQQGLVSVGIVYGMPAWFAELLPAMALVIVAAVYFRRYG